MEGVGCVQAKRMLNMHTVQVSGKKEVQKGILKYRERRGSLPGSIKQ
jgi:hypothetical protein